MTLGNMMAWRGLCHWNALIKREMHNAFVYLIIHISHFPFSVSYCIHNIHMMFLGIVDFVNPDDIYRDSSPKNESSVINSVLSMFLLSFWALNVVVALLDMQGQKALGFHKKYLNLCSEEEWRSYRFGTTRGWVINDRIFIFGWTIPSRTHIYWLCTVSKKFEHTWLEFVSLNTIWYKGLCLRLGLEKKMTVPKKFCAEPNEF